MSSRKKGYFEKLIIWWACNPPPTCPQCWQVQESRRKTSLRHSTYFPLVRIFSFGVLRPPFQFGWFGPNTLPRPCLLAFLLNITRVSGVTVRPVIFSEWPLSRHFMEQYFLRSISRITTNFNNLSHTRHFFVIFLNALLVTFPFYPLCSLCHNLLILFAKLLIGLGYSSGSIVKIATTFGSAYW